MPYNCEFPGCSNDSTNTKVNRLRIHESLSAKWTQVFDQDLNNRIGEYLYICCAHFDINTKKLILPNPTKAKPTEPTGGRAHESIRSQPIDSTVKRKTATQANVKKKSFVDDDDEENTKYSYKKSKLKDPMSQDDTQDSIMHVEMISFDDPYIDDSERKPDIKTEPDSFLLDRVMQPKVLLNTKWDMFESSSTAEDEKRYNKLLKKVAEVEQSLEEEKRKNIRLEKDISITKNRIEFIENNFGGGASKLT